MRHKIRGQALAITFCLVVLFIVGVLMFTGKEGKNVRYQNGPTTVECHSSGPDVTYCISATSVAR